MNETFFSLSLSLLSQKGPSLLMYAQYYCRGILLVDVLHKYFELHHKESHRRLVYLDGLANCIIPELLFLVSVLYIKLINAHPFLLKSIAL